MPEQPISKQHHASFEGIRQIDEAGNEFWSARDLAPLLEYQQWRNFKPVIEKAQQACVRSEQSVPDHFAHMRKMVDLGSGAQREVVDDHFSQMARMVAISSGAKHGLNLPRNGRKPI